MNGKSVDLAFLAADSVVVAQQLIGWRLYRRESAGLVGGMIIETEAYDQTDAASHSFGGETPRTQVMFGPAGYIYVYFTYGMHHCLNIVTGQLGEGSAVLIRAVQPDEGLKTIQNRRQHRPDAELTNGPAKLCQALQINLQDNGKRLNHSEFLLLPPLKKAIKTQATKRIGISRDVHRLWRFIITE